MTIMIWSDTSSIIIPSSRAPHMSNQLTLPALEIRGYRGIRELKIERLGRANLIVGKNNVGKTSILEALRLYAQPGSLDVLFDILEARDEYVKRLQDRPPVQLPIEQLFNHRGAPYHSFPRPFVANLHKTLDSVLLSVESFDASSEEDKELQWMIQGFGLSALEPARRRTLVFMVGVDRLRYPIGNAAALASLRHQTASQGDRFEIHRKPCYFIGSNGLSPTQVADLWDQIVLTPAEDDVIDALGLIAPREISRIVIKYVEDAIQPRVAFAKLISEPNPVPLRSFGDGVNRMFGIASAMSVCKGGLLLIDEIENGIHYRVQAEIWRFLFTLATRLNVQIFATTHSWDMVKAFQIASRESEEEGVLIRLAQKDGQTLVAEFDEGELETAVDGQIEVR
jgi:hypothetical protein